MKMPVLGEACLGALTFCASTYPNDKCGPNGLPLTPNSIKLLGRFQQLRAIEHPRLCTYLNLVRGKHERIIIVAEHYPYNLKLAAKDGKFTAGSELLRIAFEVLQGLDHMNQHCLVHRSLTLENVLLDSQNHVKLSKYGMYHMTGFGADVSFPIGKPKYLAPEAICNGTKIIGDCGLGDLQVVPSGPKVDVWSLGIILLELMLGGPIWSQLTLSQVFYKIMGFLRSELHPLDLLLKDCGAQDKLKEWPPGVEQLLRICLNVSPSKRPLPCELLKHALFCELSNNAVPFRGAFNMFSVEMRCLDVEIEPFDEEKAALEEVDHLGERSLQEVYYLWQLAGGDLFGTLKKAGLIKSKKPIMSLSSFILEDGEMFGQTRDQSVLLDDTVILLSLDQLRQRLSNMDEVAYYPLLEEESCNGGDGSGKGLPTSPSNVDLSETARLPLVIREKDVEYQFHRIILYERLLKAYPYKRPHIWREARIDIPPLVRGLVWSALLEVEGDVYGRYDAIDKETPTQTDRQIEVDVPRCHQYSELLSSPAGHAKFKRILKAWVATHQHYVYWQGLDSLCAPFLYLNFNDEALAYSCFTAFIPKYLHKFFLKDNSQVIQEYLAVFSHLIAFHEPELSNHLEGIGFIPDLYAIPWFLTMYAHVFPLHKIFHLWDTLLLGNSSFPLCIGVAILQQLRDQLLSYGFNECILLFSDMPEIDIERCVQDSIKIFCTTPKSATYRAHACPPRKAITSGNSRPTVSYYSQDYNETPRTELSMEPIPLEELKVEKCPRISAEDLIELCELQGPSQTRSPSKQSKSSKPRIIIIDVRSPEEYQRGSVLNSINMPFASTFDGEGKMQASSSVQLLNSQRYLVKVVMGSRGKNAVHFAESLVKAGYSKVCVLHKGVEVMRAAGLLVVPTPDL